MNEKNISRWHHAKQHQNSGSPSKNHHLPVEFKRSWRRSPRRWSFFFFLLNLADPKYTRSLKGEVSSPACVRTLKCFHLDLFTPAWSQRSLKSGGRDGDGGFPPLCPSHSRHQALLCSAANQPARRRQQISSPGQGCGHLGTNQIQTSPLEDDSMCLVLRFVCLFVRFFLRMEGGKTF